MDLLARIDSALALGDADEYGALLAEARGRIGDLELAILDILAQNEGLRADANLSHRIDAIAIRRLGAPLGEA